MGSPRVTTEPAIDASAEKATSASQPHAWSTHGQVCAANSGGKPPHSTCSEVDGRRHAKGIRRA